jgi:hypothetical protein
MKFTGTITFDPNQIGGDSALVTINYTINGVAGVDTFTIYGVVNGSVTIAHIGVTSPTSGCIRPNDTDTKELDVMLRDPIPDALGVTQVTYIVSYNTGQLFNPTYNPPVGSSKNGWSLASRPVELPNGLQVTMNYTPGVGVTPANTTLLAITQYGAISSSLSSTATLTAPHFNDSSFEACTLKALVSTTDSAQVCIDTTCPTNFLLWALQGNLQPVTGIQVIPNPAHKGTSAANLHFTTNIGANVTADVLDELGNSVATLTTGSLETGDHTLAIPTGQMPEGTYFARITVNGYTVVRKFVLEKE